MRDYTNRLLYGITTVEQICEECGKSRAYTVAGKIEGATANTTIV